MTRRTKALIGWTLSSLPALSGSGPLCSRPCAWICSCPRASQAGCVVAADSIRLRPTRGCEPSIIEITVECISTDQPLTLSMWVNRAIPSATEWHVHGFVEGQQRLIVPLTSRHRDSLLVHTASPFKVARETPSSHSECDTTQPTRDHQSPSLPRRLRMPRLSRAAQRLPPGGTAVTAGGATFADVVKPVVNQEAGAHDGATSSPSAFSIPPAFCPLCGAGIAPETIGKRFCPDCGGAWR